MKPIQYHFGNSLIIRCVNKTDENFRPFMIHYQLAEVSWQMAGFPLSTTATEFVRPLHTAH